jgi:serine/threonine-protein kinase
MSRPPQHRGRSTGPYDPDPGYYQRGPTGPHDAYDDYFDEPFRRGPHPAVIIVTALLTSAVTVTGLHFFTKGSLGSGNQTQVPELVGMPLERARATAQAAQLSLQVMGNVADPLVAKGAVARQVPLAGTKVPAGSNVAATLSAGPSSVTVPSLSRLPLATAANKLGAMGLRVGSTTHEAVEGAVAGTVTSTNPPAGTRVAPGASVNLVVARAAEQTPPQQPALPAPKQPRPRAHGGTGTVSVPKVTGMRLQFASGRLSARGLSVGRVSHSSDEDHMENFVLRQSPLPGTPVPRGSSVDLVINRTD